MGTAAKYRELLAEVAVRYGYRGRLFRGQRIAADLLMPRTGIITSDLFADILELAEGNNPQGSGGEFHRRCIAHKFRNHIGALEFDAKDIADFDHSTWNYDDHFTEADIVSTSEPDGNQIMFDLQREYREKSDYSDPWT